MEWIVKLRVCGDTFCKMCSNCGRWWDWASSTSPSVDVGGTTVSLRLNKVYRAIWALENDGVEKSSSIICVFFLGCRVPAATSFAYIFMAWYGLMIMCSDLPLELALIPSQSLLDWVRGFDDLWSGIPVSEAHHLEYRMSSSGEWDVLYRYVGHYYTSTPYEVELETQTLEYIIRK